MEQKIKSLKIASKVISIITKIGYIAMIVVISICAAMLIFMAVTGGKLSMLTIGGTNIIFYDSAAVTPAMLAAICAVLIVLGGIFLAIFLLAYRMFHEISHTGEPFEEKYVGFIRAVGILTAVVPFAAGIADGIGTALTGMEMPEIFTAVPGVGAAAIIFCLSYIIDYGCALRKKLNADSESEAE